MVDSIDFVTPNSNNITEIVEPKGTQILPNSAKTGFVRELSPYFLKSVSLSECQSSGESPDYELHNKLTEVAHTDSTLIINFSYIETCGSDFLCEVELLNNNTLNLIYYQYGSYASCRCCYGLEFSFGKHLFYDPDFYSQLDDLPTIKYIMFNGKDKVALQ
jgi:hypothetical protein